MKNTVTLLFAFAAAGFQLQAQTNSAGPISQHSVVQPTPDSPQAAFTQTPTLSSPLDMSTGIPASSATLVWNSVPNGILYEVEVARDTAFTIGLFSTQTGATVYFTPALMPLTTYYWRVRANDQVSFSSWSTVWQFNTDNSTSIAEYNGVGLSLFPVPCNDKLVVVSQQPLNRVTLTDLQGRIVLDVLLNNESRVELETADFPPGIYVLRADNMVRKVQIVR
jgi:hypothetical protein